jgi:hypothetical protein
MPRATAMPRPRRQLALVFALGALLLAVGIPSPVAAATTYPKAERYALRLTNCMRTGGYVTSGGRCRGYGTGSRRGLRLSTGISIRVARPWARWMVRNRCLCHGNYDSRFAAAGYHRYNGESLTRGSWGSIRRDIISGIRIIQTEKSYNGWHWRNLMNRRFSRVGVGIARGNGSTYVVYDFYD